MSQSRCIALFAVSGFIKYLLLIDYANIYLFSKSFSIDFSRWKRVQRILHIAYISFLN